MIENKSINVLINLLCSSVSLGNVCNASCSPKINSDSGIKFVKIFPFLLTAFKILSFLISKYSFDSEERI